MSLFAELKRRNVVRVGVAYAIVGWVIAQIAEFAFENFGAPEWVLKTVVVILLLGLPLALFFAWAFEMTPEGVKREKDVDRSQSITGNTGHKLDKLIIGALVVALAYFLWERQAADSTPDIESTATSSSQQVAPDNVEADAVTAERSIAVLPFVNMSSDIEQEWFSDGLTEEILNALARTPDLLVAARTSSFKFKGSTDDVPTIAESLGVAHVLEGSVRRGGDQLRITAQLIRARDGFHLWSQTYDRSPDDVIAVQEDIAVEIAVALQTALDPEALKQMMSAGTNSVAAYNAYLEGLAYGVSTISTGDAFEMLRSLDAFTRAVEFDPQFALGYWELAQFWVVQLQENNIVAGNLDLSNAEMRLRFDEAIENAIRYERDAVTKSKYRVTQALQNGNYAQALRLNSAFLEQRPNDQSAQDTQLQLLVEMSLDEELKAAILEFQQRDGHDFLVVNDSMTFSLVTDDREFVREFAQTALRRLGDSAFIRYQAHRALLWSGDVDGAAQLLPFINASDLPMESKSLVALRQACAENRLSDAAKLFDRLMATTEGDASMNYIGNMIFGQTDAANAALKPLDDSSDIAVLKDFVSYAYFDAYQFPNLLEALEAQGITPRQPKAMPYRCKFDQ
jgi:TolB-like protein